MAASKANLDYQLTIKQAAARLQVDPVTIRRWISDGKLRAYRYGPGRIIRIDPADLLKLRKPVSPLAGV